MSDPRFGTDFHSLMKPARCTLPHTFMSNLIIYTLLIYQARNIFVASEIWTFAQKERVLPSNNVLYHVLEFIINIYTKIVLHRNSVMVLTIVYDFFNCLKK